MAALLQELDASELSKLPKAVQNKLEKILSDQQYEIDSLKAQQEQFRVDSGKHFLAVSHSLTWPSYLWRETRWGIEQS